MTTKIKKQKTRLKKEGELLKQIALAGHKFEYECQGFRGFGSSYENIAKIKLNGATVGDNINEMQARALVFAANNFIDMLRAVQALKDAVNELDGLVPSPTIASDEARDKAKDLYSLVMDAVLPGRRGNNDSPH